MYILYQYISIPSLEGSFRGVFSGNFRIAWQSRSFNSMDSNNYGWWHFSEMLTLASWHFGRTSHLQNLVIKWARVTMALHPTDDGGAVPFVSSLWLPNRRTGVFCLKTWAHFWGNMCASNKGLGSRCSSKLEKSWNCTKLHEKPCEKSFTWCILRSRPDREAKKSDSRSTWVFPKGRHDEQFRALSDLLGESLQCALWCLGRSPTTTPAAPQWLWNKGWKPTEKKFSAPSSAATCDQFLTLPFASFAVWCCLTFGNVARFWCGLIVGETVLRKENVGVPSATRRISSPGQRKRSRCHIWGYGSQLSVVFVVAVETYIVRWC